MAVRWKKPRTNIFIAPSRSRRERALRWRVCGARRRVGWAAVGFLLQFLRRASESARAADLHPGHAPEGTVPHTVEEDDAWVEGRALVSTVEDVELIDPALSSERLVCRCVA